MKFGQDSDPRGEWNVCHSCWHPEGEHVMPFGCLVSDCTCTGFEA